MLRHKTITVFRNAVSREDVGDLRQHFLVNFRQVVFISSANLVQLCNFMKRCRKEQKRYSYLVMLEFAPYRDTWRLLDVAADLNLTVVVYAGYERAEVYPRCDYVLDMIAPCVFGCVEKLSGHCFLLGQKSYEHECLFNEWMNRKTPQAWDFDQRKKQKPHPKASKNKPCATKSMSVQRACELLEISEAQWGDVETINRAFRKKAFKFHPDKYVGQQDTEKERARLIFMELNEAKTFLLQ